MDVFCLSMKLLHYQKFIQDQTQRELFASNTYIYHTGIYFSYLHMDKYNITLQV